MPNMNVSFQGATLIKPGVYYSDDVSAVPGPGQPPLPLLVVGYGYGCEPQTIYQFASAADFQAAVRGGPVAEYIPFLANPSPQIAGAQLITYINVGSNTQSTSTLANSGSTTVITLTSADYGSPSNLLQRKVEAGSTAGRKITLIDNYSGATVVGDNLGVPLQIAYTGASSGVTYSVLVSGSSSYSLLLQSPTAGESVTIPLSSSTYATVADVVNYINGTGFYLAQALSDSGGYLPSTSLNAVTSGSLPIAVSGAYQYENVNSSVSDIVFWANRFGGFVTATAASGATNVTGNLPVTGALTFFTGGTSVPPVTQDYADAFNLALTTPAWTVFADSNAAAVQALGVQHVETASNIPYGMWRRFVTGSSLGDSVSATATAARQMNSKRTDYLYPGIYRTDTATGENTLYSGLHAAAAVAGMSVGSLVAVPLTNKALVANGVEATLSISSINTLQQNGAMPITVPFQTGVPTIASDQTTWQTDANPENVFAQQVSCRDWLAYSLVNAARPYVGTIASPQSNLNILNAVKATLNALVWKPGSNGILSSWNPASLQLTYTGATQTAAISVDVTLVGQNRFITIYVPIQPLSFTLTAATV